MVLFAIHPSVVKLSLTDLGHTGRTAGALAGTFFTGFVLVSTLPTRPIILTTGGLLVAAALVFARPFPLIPVTLAAAFTWLLPGPCHFESSSTRPPLDFARAEVGTLRGVFAHVAVIAAEPITAALGSDTVVTSTTRALVGAAQS